MWQRSSADYKNYLPRGLHVLGGKKRGVYQGLSASHTTGTDRLLFASILNRLLLKTIKCKKGDDHNPSITIKLQFWEMAEGERILLNIYICCRNSHGALVFWDPTCALSPDRVPKCLKDVKNKAYQERMSYCLLSLSINPVRSCLHSGQTSEICKS